MATSSRLLTARTRRLDPGDPRHAARLVELLPGGPALSWVRDGDGLVGWGEAARFDAAGPNRFAEADEWWQRLTQRFEVDDEVGLPGCGPVAFGSLAFADHPGGSALVVPEVLIGQRDGVRWITTIGGATADPVLPAAPRSPGAVAFREGSAPAAHYREAVAEAVDRMRGGAEVAKVVLAHDLIAETAQPLDQRYLLRDLAARYPSCWTFAVDGLVGATPELLLERTGSEIRSQVLAGTAWPRPGRTTEELAAELRASEKDRHEHDYAAESLARRLRPFCAELAVRGPEVLALRNVLHLATDLAGRLDERAGASLLRMVGAVHPTAAVGGTPTDAAVRLIDELERMDRDRYAGPVGWLDGRGNGQFGVALRCAQVRDREVRLFAGCGIVADSDPDLEVAEAQAKLRPIREALAPEG
ncbi:isochorismate synthase [Saccharopolyspora cebuensis]|uniref:isochorismate synthase n=1 Tax=Saccharopolyspora cebuensis TaxID=418759 RepID=A0ABV4CPP1_9PSEU